MTERRTQSQGTALVTGASAGIGLSLTKLFAEGGFDLVLVARRKAELEALAERCGRDHGVRAEAIPLDLLAPDAPAQLVDRLDADGRAIDVLVNNAGLMEMGRFAEIDLEKHERLLQLNVLVLASLTHRLLQPMVERGRGRILNVASTSSFQPVPSLALYAASKAFVLSISESLSEELKGTGVTVTALCPGITRTEMLDRAEGEHEAVQRLPRFMLSDVEDVARAGYDACMAGQAVVVPGLPNRVAASLAQLYPRWLVRTLGGIVGRRTT
jgi:short-subunit dehydrogenase